MSFLKTSAAGTAALTGLTAAANVHAAGSDIIKIGMIGAGDRCRGAATQSLQADPGVRLVAIGDLFKDRVDYTRSYLKDNFKDQVQVADDHLFVGFDNYKHVIDSADVVLIACASKFHPMYAEAALKAGKNVFVEKPHGIDPVGVRRMAAACELAKQKNLSILSGLQSRFHAGFRECVARIHDGAIGQVTSIQAMFLRGPYRLEPRQTGVSELEFQCRNWYHFRWLSGDDVPQSLVHNMDRVAWILKEEMPAWCFGLGGRSASFGEVYGDMFDHHTVAYEYKSGARVYALCRTQVNTYGNASDLVTGTKGTCDLGNLRIAGENPWKFAGKQNDPYLAEQKALIEAVRSGQPINSGYHMANSTMSTVMGQVACYTGKPVTWDETMKSELEVPAGP